MIASAPERRQAPAAVRHLPKRAAPSLHRVRPRSPLPAPWIGDLSRAALVSLIAGALLGVIGWRFFGVAPACRPADAAALLAISRLAIDGVAGRIVTAESRGDANAKNELSSATGSGQFLDATWLDMVRATRPDLAEMDDGDLLDLRSDNTLSREMVARLAGRNATVLARHCLPVTAGTLYLSHFAGGAGAVAVLSAPASADAAATMAGADATGRTTRAAIVTANPFLGGYTVADLKSWADRKVGADKP